ncbi:MAG TPA: SOS response-associated peptidase [Bacillota bacterium]|nr:SOS response-associated peptidase [Bacillota bacterium]
MCGRFSLSKIDQLSLRFGVEAVGGQARYNIAPTQTIPVVVNDQEPRLVQMRWGLIPSWAKDKSLGNKMINARAETVAEKPSFKGSLVSRRCIIPADGFFEWKDLRDMGKQPYRITHRDEQLLGFAGLWDVWSSPEGERVYSCTIITTTPNELMAPIHNRMPVILTRETEMIWLDPTLVQPQLLQEVLRPYPSDLLKAYPVSKAVNSSTNDLAECVLPLC